MNYIQTLFSIFNAPLFATFIIAMFWKRGHGVGRLLSAWSPGTAAAYATNRLAAYHIDLPLRLGAERAASGRRSSPSSSAASCWSSCRWSPSPSPSEDLGGLVWGLTRKEEAEEDADPRDKLWWRSPWLLGGVAIAILVVLNIIFA